MTDVPQTEQQPEEETPPPAITEAWGSLCTWATRQRLDWDGDVIWAELRAAQVRGVPYRAAYETLAALAWKLDAGTKEVLGEVANLKRSAGHQGTHGIPAGDRQALVTRLNEATRRHMGTTPAVPRQGGSAESTETKES